jgi:opacity protein-like surface antigen
MYACDALAGIESSTSDNQFLLGVSAGATWAFGNKSQTISLEPDVQKTYHSDNNGSVLPTIELYSGIQKNITFLVQQPLISQLGISLVGAGSAKLSGDIWEDGDPAFDNFNYHYKINHTHVAIKGRLIYPCNAIQPYVSGSVGVGFNRAYDFTITPKISEAVPAPEFTSNTTTTLAYTLGLGIQKSLNPQLQVALGYEFTDFGKIQLSRATGQILNQGLSLNHLYTQQIQLSLFYII